MSEEPAPKPKAAIETSSTPIPAGVQESINRALGASEEPKPDRHPLIQSSADPTKISLTIKGLSVFVPSLVMLAATFGIDLDPQTVGEFVNELAVMTGAMMTLVGLLRKLVLMKQEPK
jgi:hypothetical protein